MTDKPAHALIDRDAEAVTQTLPKMDSRDRFVAAWIERTSGLTYRDIALLTWHLANREWTNGNTSARDELNDG